MTDPRRRTRVAEVCERLNTHGARYVVVGATAMQFWGTTRATRDIDILIEPTIDNARRVIDALTGIGFGLARDIAPEELLSAHVTMIGDTPNVDVLTLAWSVRYSDVVERAATFTVEGVSVPVVAIDDLIASKRTDRLQDRADIEVLEAIKRLRPHGDRGN